MEGLLIMLTKVTMFICIGKLTNMAFQPLQVKLDAKIEKMKKEMEI